MPSSNFIFEVFGINYLNEKMLPNTFWMTLDRLQNSSVLNLLLLIYPMGTLSVKTEKLHLNSLQYYQPKPFLLFRAKPATKSSHPLWS
jgi:hypothetical protein